MSLMLAHLGPGLFTLFKDIVPIFHSHFKPKQGGTRYKQANSAQELEKPIEVCLEARGGSDPTYTRNICSEPYRFSCIEYISIFIRNETSEAAQEPGL